MLMLAGKGERLRPFSEVRAKPLLPVLGIPVVQYAISHLREHGVTRMVGNLHHLADQTEKEIGNLDWQGASWIPSDERSALLGSAGGVRHALNALGPDPFFVVNGDVVFPVDLAELEDTHQRLRQSRGVQITLSVLPRGPDGETYRRIEWDQQTGCVVRLGEKEVGAPYFAGTYIAEPEAFAALPDGRPSDFVVDVLQPAIQARKVGVYESTAPWFDIGCPELWLDAHFKVQEQVRKGRIVLPKISVTAAEEFRIHPDRKTVEYAPYPESTRKNSIWYRGTWGPA